MFRSIALLQILLASALSCTSAGASVVTVGSLTRDTEQHLISDTLNARQWLGWDFTRGRTYAQTFAETAAGGAFEGFTIARNVDAQMFVAAAVSTPYCTTQGSQYCAFGQSSDLNKIVGENGGSTVFYDSDLVFFLSDNGTGSDVGLLRVTTHTHSESYNDIVKLNEWGDWASANFYGNPGYPENFGWLLYREAGTSIPEPGSLLLVIVALASLTKLRRQSSRPPRQFTS